MAVKIVLEILSPCPMTTREDGKLVFDLWQQYLPGLLPDKYGNWEPVDRPFDVRNLERVLDAWQWPFLAVKRKPVVDVGVWMRKSAHQRLHAIWIFRLDAGAASQTELLGLLQAASITLNADFGCLHLLTPSEVERGRASKVVSVLNRKATKFSFLIGSNDLQDRIPDLFWATVLGSPYVKMFGHDRLLSAPTYRVQSLSDKSVLLQITENLSDVENRVGAFEEARSRVKGHLDSAAFFQPTGQIFSYRVPQFDFPTNSRPLNTSGNPKTSGLDS